MAPTITTPLHGIQPVGLRRANLRIPVSKAFKTGMTTNKCGRPTSRRCHAPLRFDYLEATALFCVTATHIINRVSRERQRREAVAEDQRKRGDKEREKIIKTARD